MKNILKKLLFALLLFVAGDAMAQADYEDVVYLKNGSIIHGIIMEQVPNESLKIQTKDKNTFVFKMDEIEKISKERITPQAKPAEKTHTDKTIETNARYMLALETNFGPGIGNNNSNRMTFGMHIINGVSINNFFSVGAGIGFEFMNDHDYNSNSGNYYGGYSHEYLLMAYYIDLRITPLKGNITPLIILNYGYAGDLFSSAVNGGVLLNAGLGGKFYLTHRLGMNLSLNYKHQQLHYDEGFFNNDVNQTPDRNWNTTLDYMCITFGVSF